jgi:hypothetical protein
MTPHAVPTAPSRYTATLDFTHRDPVTVSGVPRRSENLEFVEDIHAVDLDGNDVPLTDAEEARAELAILAALRRGD